MNNLDPEVAERPDDLVVYGGTGRAARDWRELRRDRPHPDHARGRRDAARAVRQAGRRAAHPRVGAAGADRQLQPGRRLGDLAGVPPPRAARPDDVRPDDRRVVDLHRHPGHPAGHLRDVRRPVAAKRFGGHARRHAHRSPAAAAAWAARSRSPSRSTAASAWSSTSTRPACAGASSTRYLDEVAADLDDACAAVLAAKARAARAVGRAGRQLRRGAARAAAPRASTVDVVTDQTSAHDPLSLPADRRRRSRTGTTTPRPSPRSSPTGRGRRWPGTSRRWSASWTPAPRCSTTATRSATRPATAATSGRSPSPASCPPTSGRCSARARARSAGRRCPATPRDIAATDRAVLDLFPDDDHLHRWIRAAQERVAFQGLPARICWLGLRRARPRRAAVQRDGRVGRAGRADRHRPRPPRLAARSRRRTGRPRRWLDGSDAIADWPLLNALINTRRPARPGCRSTTAAASASAARSTPGR